MRVVVIQSNSSTRGSSLTFGLPTSGPATGDFGDGDDASVMSGTGSILSYMTQTAGTPALYHLGGGVFRQREEGDGEGDAEVFSLEKFTQSKLMFGLSGMMRTFEVGCDSAVMAQSVKDWLQQFVDEAQRSNGIAMKQGKRLGPLGLPMRR